MVVVGLVRTALGDPPIAESAQYGVEAESLTQAGIILLLLRSFASGCAALTGVEAISNGVPAFRRPKIKNAQRTLVAMGLIARDTVQRARRRRPDLADPLRRERLPSDRLRRVRRRQPVAGSPPQLSLIAQIAAATFGDGTVLFFIIQAATAAVLLLAANTAFNGFPLLGSVLARDGYAPKSLATRGDRLIYSNGVLALSAVAALILVVYQANVTALIQLYIIGVFTSFTLGQTGMVRHWLRLLRNGATDRGAIWRSLVDQRGRRRHDRERARSS